MTFGESSKPLVNQRISPFRVLVAGTSWRLFGSRAAGDTLLDVMSGDNEQNRMLAGMSLVKAGQRSSDLIKKKIDAGEASAPIIRLLPDLDGEGARAVLEDIARGETGSLRDAARECIDLLDRIAALEPDN